jgi:glucosamine--fructose-6-phosphate aminotransferase (isomerizing)
LASHLMIKEIREQSEAFRKVLSATRQKIRAIAQEAWKTKRPESYYLVGCGSSFYAAMIPAFHYEYSLGLNAAAIPSSEFVWFAPRPGAASPLLVALSRSGRTSETVEATRKARKVGVPTVAVTSDAKSTMGQECDYSIDMGIPTDESVIMTKTFTCSALSSLLLGVEFAKARGITVPKHLEDDLAVLPNGAEEVVETVEDQAKKIAEASSEMIRFVYLGSGANYAACLEGALKLRETAYVASEAYHSMEFRHGPFAELQKGIQVFGVVPKGKAVAQQLTLLKEIGATGATVVPISNAPEILDSFKDSIRMPESASSEFNALLYMIPMQIFAYCYAVMKGRNPDQPRNLSRYVTTEIKP